MSPNPIPLDELLDRTGWLRSLARHLVDDPHAADDLVQDAVVAALQCRRDPVRNWAGWLARVVRRGALRRRRSEALRARHERQLAGTPRSAPPADAVVAKAALQRELCGFVLEMESPYRETLLLRYFEDLSPKQIAAELGVPIDTVYARLRRGLARLRGRLEGADPDWRATLAPLVLSGPPAPLPDAGGGSVPASAADAVTASAVSTATVAMSLPVKTTVGACCTALLAFALWATLTDPGPPTQPGATDPPPPNDRRAAGRDAAVTGPGNATGAAPSRQSVGAGTGGGFAVRGIVDQEGVGIRADARVAARMLRGYEGEGIPEREATLTTGADGTFTWDLPVPDHTVRLRFTSAEPQTWHGYGEVLVVRGEPAPDRVLVRAFPLDVWIAGRVLDGSGQPVAGALVRNPFAEREVLSGADGRYQIQSTSISSNAVLVCRAAGFAMVRAEIATGSRAGRMVHDFALQPGLVLRGRVLDGAGAPLAGVRISSSFWFGPLGDSAGDGSFVLESLDPTLEQQLLWFRHATHLPRQVTVPTADAQRELVVTLESGARVSGRVFGPGGTPLAGVGLRIARPESNGDATVSRDDGSFAFERAPRGDLALTATRDGMAKTSQPVTVGEEPVRDLVVVMQPERFLSGRVVDDRGEPVGKAGGVAAFRDGQHYLEGGRCDAEGRFRLRGLPPGEVRLEVYAAGYRRRSIAGVAAGTADLEIVLQRGAGFAGRVVDAASGAPVEQFKVRIVTPERRDGERSAGSYNASWAVPGMSFKSKTGSFSTGEMGDREFVAGGILGFEITAPGYAPFLQRRVAAVLDPKPEDWVVELHRAGVVRGRVLAAGSGAPIAGATVRVTAADRPLHLVGDAYEHTAITARTDERGRFAIPDAPLGEIALRVEHLDHPWHLDPPFTLASGGVVERVIQVGAGGRISGHTPTPGVVHLCSPASAAAPDFHAEVRTAGDGSFAFPRALAPGDYLVYQLRDAGTHREWLQARTTLEAGGARTVELRGGAGGGLRSRPAAHWRTGMFRPAGRGPWIQVPLRDHEFEVRGLPPGRYAVRGLGAGAVTVEVTAGAVVEAKAGAIR